MQTIKTLSKTIIPIFDNPQNVMTTGKGSKKLLVAYTVPHEESSLLQPLPELLQKMITAIKHDLEEDVYFVAFHENAFFAMTDFLKTHEVEKIILFGIAPMQIGWQLQLQRYQPIHFNYTSILLADSLADIEANPALKAPLWEQMKAMFLG